MSQLTFVYVVIFMAFVFDFVNGFHDAANSIATLVSTKILKPLTAVLWAAFFNFIAFLFFDLHVANTLGVGLVDPSLVTPHIIFAGLCGAILFNVITAYLGIPSSSSHALIGGLLGAMFTKHGLHSLIFSGVFKTLIAIIISPLLGVLLCIFLLFIINKFLHRYHHHFNKKLQLISAALLSLAHGGNDAQKTMGIIAVLLFSANILGDHFYVPLWVVISCNFVMAIGTFFGGWRIVKTIGEKITPLDAKDGAAVQTSSAIILFLTTHLGIPTSTTHTVTGSVTGAGIYKSDRPVNWKILKNIGNAWFLTIPCSAFVAGLISFFV
ncbi:MAG: inorganic phosphate transporter [Gammaproteobacteria bacterium]|nr:inorganic phosphate transporter [Gammaproteobacteria bacterium]MCD8542388.1 inorganic phosphate transporter [Gammaproteobacteria bacterium]